MHKINNLELVTGCPRGSQAQELWQEDAKVNGLLVERSQHALPYALKGHRAQRPSLVPLRPCAARASMYWVYVLCRGGVASMSTRAAADK
jgi:hypothetical protein